VASGTLAPTVNLVRRWLANDTWELLGGPVPEECSPGQLADGPRAARVLAAVPEALAAAWSLAVRHGGADPARWRWSDVHQTVRVHPLGQVFPGTPMGGDSDTIQAAGYGWVPDAPFTVTSLSVYRQVIDLADPAAASFAIPGGSSGDPASPHFADQLAVWAQHLRMPMNYRLGLPACQCQSSSGTG
jgi:penicillin amidase